MSSQEQTSEVDLFIIGGGINGCGIARDAAGRGLSVVLAEMNDLASATSSASTKLFHGGLRYLEFFEVRLVREALREREILLQAMPHISWPMRFVLPYHKDMRFEGDTPISKILNLAMPWMRGRRPAWLIRFGLLLYDNLGGREILPNTTTVDLTVDPVGQPLQDRFVKAFEYSDCWIDDSRLVILNARDAQAHGAKIITHNKVLLAERVNDVWHITTEDQRTKKIQLTIARMLINAGGPWAEDIIRSTARINSSEVVRLVRGSHIVTRKLYDHDKCYFFQGEDGRIIFAIPYETDFTLIGTTDLDHEDASIKPECSDAEADYLRTFASNYFKQPITKDDVVWTYSGVRPLYDDGTSSATAATRDYVLRVNQGDGAAPLLNIFGGKITTYRKLAEAALAKIIPFFPKAGPNWTAGVSLPGGDFPVDGVRTLIHDLRQSYPFLDEFWARRLVKAYGTEALLILGDAKSTRDLGKDFAATLTEREIVWLMEKEYAYTANDVVWRRSRLGLRMSKAEIAELETWMKAARSGQKIPNKHRI